MVSKIFPAGFGWQYASCVADGMGFAGTSVPFALITGLGDATGVFLGHTIYKAIQGAVAPSMNIQMGSEVGVGAWLATAAFCAGSSWQPIVNFLHDSAHLSFTPVFAGTMAGCGFMFYGGLRLGRMIFPWMSSPPGSNAQDFGLGMSIGGATGCFVATDTSFIGADSDALYKVLGPVFNVTDDTSTIMGCIKAGGSTFTGYGVVNSVQNAALPAGLNWQDGNNAYC